MNSRVEPTPIVLALVTDLMFRAQIRECAESLGRSVQFFRTSAELRERLGVSPNVTVVVDLHCKGGEGVPGARVAKELGARRVVSYLSHVDEALHAEALALGSEVVARSRFMKMLPELFGVSAGGA